MSQSEPQQLLLVDRDLDYLEWATKHLDAENLTILRCNDAEKATKVIQKTKIDVLVTDLKLEPFDGLTLIQKNRAASPHTVNILTVVSPSSSQIIKATQNGAFDVLRKESLAFELRHVVESALQAAEQRREIGNPTTEIPSAIGKNRIIGISRPFQNVMKTVGRVARSEAPVLITGESGTGKELIARSIHDYSPRRAKQMLVINCGAIPENLLESELFGHEKGSFTGAIARRAGRFEDADQSTLFLDEIGDLPLHVQVKLLRVLQDGTFSRVGSNETLKSDVRIVAATNKNLARDVTNGRFREDLYYRLNVVEIELPPLRERTEDVPILAEFFLERLARTEKGPRLRLTGEAIEHLQKHRWPGNVRELENTMARAHALALNEILLPEDIPLSRNPARLLSPLTEALNTLLEHAHRAQKPPLAFLQEKLLQHALNQTQQDPTQAAELLQIPPKTLNTLKKSLPDHPHD